MASTPHNSEIRPPPRKQIRLSAAQYMSLALIFPDHSKEDGSLDYDSLLQGTKEFVHAEQIDVKWLKRQVKTILEKSDHDMDQMMFTFEAKSCVQELKDSLKKLQDIKEAAKKGKKAKEDFKDRQLKVKDDIKKSANEAKKAIKELAAAKANFMVSLKDTNFMIQTWLVRDGIARPAPAAEVSQDSLETTIESTEPDGDVSIIRPYTPAETMPEDQLGCSDFEFSEVNDTVEASDKEDDEEDEVIFKDQEPKRKKSRKF